MPTSSEPSERSDVSSFLAEHTPFQGSTEAELAELAAGASVERFPADVAVADYAARVPDEIWMVRDGMVYLRASADGSLIDIVGPGGIFGSRDASDFRLRHHSRAGLQARQEHGD